MDSQLCQLVVPSEQVTYIKQQRQQALASNDGTSVSHRQLAVYMAPLQSTWHLCTYTSDLFQAMSSNTSWDAPIEELFIAVPDLQYWLENIALCNGKT